MKPRRSTRRNRLSASQMLQPPYSDMTVEQLQASYRLDLDRDQIRAYLHYTPQQLVNHYNVEVELATRLRTASRTERATLYSSLYDELFRRVPYHPQIARKSFRSALRREEIRANLALLRSFLRPDSTFLELGPGDCQLCLEVAKQAKRVYAVDVSNEITSNIEAPSNFELILSDGSSVDVPPGSIDVAFSSQLMEHLHPEDAVLHLQQIHKALALDGIYICLTPHRFGGPADVSRFFDEVARGFHLKEYTNGELRQLFKTANFSTVALLKRLGSRHIRLPLFPAILIETFLQPLPHRQRRTLYRGLKKLLAPRLIARK